MGNTAGEEQERNKALKTNTQLLVHLHGYIAILPSASLTNINKISMILCPLTSVKEVKTAQNLKVIFFKINTLNTSLRAAGLTCVPEGMFDADGGASGMCPPCSS